MVNMPNCECEGRFNLHFIAANNGYLYPGGGVLSTCSFVNVPLQLCKRTISAFFSLNVNMVWKQLATALFLFGEI